MFRRSVAFAAFIGVVALPSLVDLRAADNWTEVSSPHFRVLTNAGDGTGRNVAWQFEQVRAALETAWTWTHVTVTRPIDIIAVKGEDNMRALAPQYWEHGPFHPDSVWVGASDRYYVGMRADVQVEAQGLNPYAQAYWAYCDLILNQSFRRGLPFWLSRGMSAVISNTIVNKDSVDIGRPLPNFVAIVRNRPLMPIPQLVTVAPADYNKLSTDGAQSFDAESWALVQFLMLGDSKHRLNQVSQAIVDGASSLAAIQQAFGSAEALDDVYRLYVHQGAFRFSRLPAKSQVPIEKYAAVDVNAADSAARRASFQVAMNRPVEARALIALAKKLDPAAAGPYEAEALLFDREGNADGTSTALAQAAEHNSANYYVYYRLAIDNRSDVAKSRQYLERTIALNDQFVPAYTQLASVLTPVDPDRAAELMVKAIQLDPSAAQLRAELANILLRLGRPQDAVKVATDARPAAVDDDERTMLQQIVDAASRPAASPATRSATVGSADTRAPTDAASGQSFGAGASRPGGSITDPKVLFEVKPNYTSDAMRAKIQGTVMVEAVVLPDGTIGDVRVVRSLDSKYGLDEEALKAARGWRFEPGRNRAGQAVPVIVSIELNFVIRPHNP